MSKVFGKDKSPNNSVNRNTFDLSFVNHLTTDFGKLVPFMVKEVIPGDSAEIDLGVAFRMMPMVFPVQTKMRCDMHVFYVRNRNLWKDFPDFYGDLKTGLVPPYLTNLTGDNAGIGQLHDYLGLPNTIAGTFSSANVSVRGSSMCGSSPTYHVSVPYISNINNAAAPTSFSQLFNIFSFNPSIKYTVSDVNKPTCPSSFTPGSAYSITLVIPDSTISFGRDITVEIPLPSGASTPDGTFPAIINSLYSSPTNLISFSSFFKFDSDRGVLILNLPSSFLKAASPSNASLYLGVLIAHGTTSINGVSYNFGSLSDFPISVDSFIGLSDGVLPLYGNDSTGLAFNPFVPHGATPPPIPISALPARAYESIYNAFYRDERNNPYVIDGEKEYNKFIPSSDGGADDYNYTLHYRNWEQDFLTTAVPTPQQGNAPLVGISSSGTARFVDEETGKKYEVQLTTGDDNDTVTGVSYRENLPNSVMRSLVDVVSSGISINDFRNVNAFQRWLETNIRKGYKFRNIIGSHFGVEPSFAELDMPEFIGGHSEIINVQQISQTSQGTADSPLGSFAGQGYLMGTSRNKIRKYFDEPGFLIGIISISPVPMYSQLLPKHFIKRDVLDYFFPEFGHIGLQPITYKEVCPLQASTSGPGNYDETFGYQRAWYDYLQSVDEVHGEFRTTLRDFLINRTYDRVPTLSPDFLVIKPDQTNNIFAVNETTDHFIGLVSVGLKMKRPLPKFCYLKLE